jgi:acetylornithine deacetylase/succinyl-diaminopimelate desuccinylase-like protein
MTNNEIKVRTFELIDSRREEMIFFLRDYIQHRSINPEREIPEFERGETTACQEWLFEALKSMNCFETVSSWRVSSGEMNVAAALPATEPKEYCSALFNGHSDIVPVTAEEYKTWRGGNPWSGEVHEGALYGRGACDMKGANASVIWAARCLSEAGFRPKGQVTLVRRLSRAGGRSKTPAVWIFREG